MSEQIDAPIGSIDFLVLHNSIAIVVGWSRFFSDVTRVSFSLASGRSIDVIPFWTLRYGRSDLKAQQSQLGLEATDKAGFFAACEVPEAVAAAMRQEAVSCHLVFDEGGRLPRPDMKPLSLAAAKENLAFVHINEPIVLPNHVNCDEDSAWFVVCEPQETDLLINFDTAFALKQGGVFTSGWVENASQHAFYWYDEASGEVVPAPLCRFYPRPDVQSHLTQVRGFAPPPTLLHGFSLAFLFPEGIALPGSLRLLLRDDYDWKLARPIDLSYPRDFADALVPMLMRFCEAGTLPPSGIREFVVELENRRRTLAEDPVKCVHCFGPGLVEPARLSLIIPFYLEDFFIRHLLLMLEKLPADAEVILVCDDPGIEDALLSYIQSHSAQIVRPLKFLALAENNGYAAANNIGAEHASGEYLLLMNSDIYAQDFSWLEYGLALYQSEADIGAIGFTLQFEDNTVQHNGMVFERNPTFDNLYLTEHPGKGLPANFEQLCHRDVEACTAALLLIKVADLGGDPLFDTDYIRGDFEDSALNLKIRLSGRRIVLVQSPGIYHLERQSIRLMGQAGWRTQLTLINCQTFNYKWAATIDKVKQGMLV